MHGCILAGTNQIHLTAVGFSWTVCPEESMNCLQVAFFGLSTKTVFMAWLDPPFRLLVLDPVLEIVVFLFCVLMKRTGAVTGCPEVDFVGWAVTE